MQSTIHLTTASDLNMAPCLHIQLLSCMSHLPDSRNCTFHLYLKDFREADIDLLRGTLAEYKDRSQLIVHDVDAIELGSGHGISGNKMCYSLFAALDQDTSEHIIWIDADMIVLTDISIVWDRLIQSKKTALVVARKTLEYAHPMERRLMKSYGLQDEDPFFNSAFVAANSRIFRSIEGFSRCINFIEKHPEQGDQGAVNALFANQLELVEEKYNTPYWPHDRQVELLPEDIICHFIGSPKPWDLFAEFLHPSHAIFNAWIKKTSYYGKYRQRYLKIHAWLRLFRIIHKYGYLVKSRFERS